MKYLILICLFLSFAPSAHAVPGAGDVQKGNRFFKEGNYEKALEAWQKAAEVNPSEEVIDFNLGNGYYKAGDFDRAVTQFEKALLTDNPDILPDIYYNLGNALYKAGIQREESGLRQAIEMLGRSLDSYRKTLEQRPEDKDAKANAEFVMQELKRLKEKEIQQQQQQQQNQQSQNQEQSPSSSPESQDQDQRKKEQQREQAGQDKDQQQTGETKPQDGDREAEDQQSQSGESREDQQKQGEEESEGKDNRQSEDQAGRPDEREAEGSSQGQALSADGLSREEARTLLEDFDQNEQPRGVLNFLRERRGEKDVERDW